MGGMRCDGIKKKDSGAVIVGVTVNCYRGGES
jgi:hypothetical protein